MKLNKYMLLFVFVFNCKINAGYFEKFKNYFPELFNNNLSSIKDRFYAPQEPVSVFTSSDMMKTAFSDEVISAGVNNNSSLTASEISKAMNQFCREKYSLISNQVSGSCALVNNKISESVEAFKKITLFNSLTKGGFFVWKHKNKIAVASAALYLFNMYRKNKSKKESGNIYITNQPGARINITKA